ncbi:MAG: hypothetical protein HY462_01735 [Parcubacteria group bacterium]|nr:hypothetical protein [Parcubacteria group bacterium]
MASSKIPMIVVGPYGKALGKPVCGAILESEECALVGGVTSPNGGAAQQSETLGGVTVAGSFSALEREQSIPYHGRNDVVVLYATQGDQVLSRMQEAIRHGFHRHVVGSTDLPYVTKRYMEEMAIRGELVLHGPNFGRFATVTDWVIEVLAHILPDCDNGVTDKHHRGKVGALSGTALMYAASLARSKGLDPDVVIKRGGARPGSERQESDISVAGHRLGGLPGEHEVYFADGDGLIEITQRAYSRAGFALGALSAVVWAARRTLGPRHEDLSRKVHTMRDVWRLPNPVNMGNWQ